MKNLLCISLVLIFIIQACCTKKGCENGLDQAILAGFEPSELDTIIMKTYHPNANATQLIDSVRVLAFDNNNDGSEYTVSLKGQLDPTRDYQFVFSGLSEVYHVTDFQMGEEGCNSCFPYRPKSDYFEVLRAYSVNGHRKNSDLIYISK